MLLIVVAIALFMVIGALFAKILNKKAQMQGLVDLNKASKDAREEIDRIKNKLGIDGEDDTQTENMVLVGTGKCLHGDYPNCVTKGMVRSSGIKVGEQKVGEGCCTLPNEVIDNKALARQQAKDVQTMVMYQLGEQVIRDYGVETWLKNKMTSKDGVKRYGKLQQKQMLQQIEKEMRQELGEKAFNELTEDQIKAQMKNRMKTKMGRELSNDFIENEVREQLKDRTVKYVQDKFIQEKGEEAFKKLGKETIDEMVENQLQKDVQTYIGKKKLKTEVSKEAIDQAVEELVEEGVKKKGAKGFLQGAKSEVIDKTFKEMYEELLEEATQKTGKKTLQRSGSKVLRSKIRNRVFKNSISKLKGKAIQMVVKGKVFMKVGMKVIKQLSLKIMRRVVHSYIRASLKWLMKKLLAMATKAAMGPLGWVLGIIDAMMMAGELLDLEGNMAYEENNSKLIRNQIEYNVLYTKLMLQIEAINKDKPPEEQIPVDELEKAFLPAFLNAEEIPYFKTVYYDAVELALEGFTQNFALQLNRASKKIKVYERDADDNVKRDAKGNPIEKPIKLYNENDNKLTTPDIGIDGKILQIKNLIDEIQAYEYKRLTDSEEITKEQLEELGRSIDISIRDRDIVISETEKEEAIVALSAFSTELVDRMLDPFDNYLYQKAELIQIQFEEEKKEYLKNGKYNKDVYIHMKNMLKQIKPELKLDEHIDFWPDMANDYGRTGIGLSEKGVNTYNETVKNLFFDNYPADPKNPVATQWTPCNAKDKRYCEVYYPKKPEKPEEFSQPPFMLYSDKYRLLDVDQPRIMNNNNTREKPRMVDMSINELVKDENGNYIRIKSVSGATKIPIKGEGFGFLWAKCEAPVTTRGMLGMLDTMTGGDGKTGVKVTKNKDGLVKFDREVGVCYYSKQWCTMHGLQHDNTKDPHDCQWWSIHQKNCVEVLGEAVCKNSQRLGADMTKNAETCFTKGNIQDCGHLMVDYYLAPLSIVGLGSKQKLYDAAEKAIDYAKNPKEFVKDAVLKTKEWDATMEEIVSNPSSLLRKGRNTVKQATKFVEIMGGGLIDSVANINDMTIGRAQKEIDKIKPKALSVGLSIGFQMAVNFGPLGQAMNAAKLMNKHGKEIKKVTGPIGDGLKIGADAVAEETYKAVNAIGKALHLKDAYRTGKAVVGKIVALGGGETEDERRRDGLRKQVMADGVGVHFFQNTKRGKDTYFVEYSKTFMGLPVGKWSKDPRINKENGLEHKNYMPWSDTGFDGILGYYDEIELLPNTTVKLYDQPDFTGTELIYSAKENRAQRLDVKEDAIRGIPDWYIKQYVGKFIPGGFNGLDTRKDFEGDHKHLFYTKECWAKGFKWNDGKGTESQEHPLGVCSIEALPKDFRVRSAIVVKYSDIKNEMRENWKTLAQFYAKFELEEKGVKLSQRSNQRTTVKGDFTDDLGRDTAYENKIKSVWEINKEGFELEKAEQCAIYARNDHVGVAHVKDEGFPCRYYNRKGQLDITRGKNKEKANSLFFDDKNSLPALGVPCCASAMAGWYKGYMESEEGKKNEKIEKIGEGGGGHINNFGDVLERVKDDTRIVVYNDTSKKYIEYKVDIDRDETESTMALKDLGEGILNSISTLSKKELKKVGKEYKFLDRAVPYEVLGEDGTWQTFVLLGTRKEFRDAQNNQSQVLPQHKDYVYSGYFKDGSERVKGYASTTDECIKKAKEDGYKYMVHRANKTCDGYRSIDKNTNEFVAEQNAKLQIIK